MFLPNTLLTVLFAYLGNVIGNRAALSVVLKARYQANRTGIEPLKGGASESRVRPILIPAVACVGY